MSFRLFLVAQLIFLAVVPLAWADSKLCGRVFKQEDAVGFDGEVIPLFEGTATVGRLVEIGGAKALAIYSPSPPTLRTVRWSAESKRATSSALALPDLGPTPELLGGDFDGDGCEDLALVGTGGEVTVAWSNCTELATVTRWIEGTPKGQIYAADLDGDRRTDLIIARRPMVWKAELSLGREGTRRQGWLLLPGMEAFPARLIGDRSGDGKADLLAVSPGGAMLVAYSNGQDGFTNATVSQLFSSMIVHFERFFEGDFDGNGASDLIGREVQRNMLCLLGTGEADPIGCPFAQFLGETPWTTAVVGDFDGNGMNELLVRRWKAREWTRYRWRGKIGEDDSIPVVEPAGIDLDRATVLAGDVDGDGLDDLVFGEKHGWSFVRSRFSAPADGVALRLSSGAETRTGPDGRYCVDTSAGSEQSIAAPANSEPLSRPIKAPSEAAGRANGLNFLIHADAIAEGPRLCVGFVEGSWGRRNSCPKNYAFYGVDDSSSVRRGVASGPCCRLPADDIDLPEVIAGDLVCPDDSILIGWNRLCETCSFTVLCRKINTNRYQLGPPTEGAYWGFGYTRWGENTFVPRMSLPPTLRYGIGRLGFVSWDVDGCVGMPIGSLLTGRPAGYCSGTRFRQLQYRGVPGDPPLGSPVKMLPDCREIDSIFSAGTRCTR